MSAVPRTGVAIKQCTDFMREVYREVSALFGDIDLVFADAGWSPVWSGNLVFAGISNAIEALPSRFPRSMGRVYAHARTGEPARHAAIVEVHLSPSFDADEATLVLTVVGLEEALAPDSIRGLYSDSDFAGNLLQQHGYTPGTAKDLTRDEHPRVFSGAPHLRIIAWPLTQMTSREALKQTVVAELTRAVAAQAPGGTGTTK
ncbi:hypothetical protein HPC49_18700 [Pyxidicoccus fallax]|uniref:Uncharacterized protein n=1 Tax=Pyxidicoccus fallax TaxID=394095 RepID=A0A848LNW9_9BACT|nr:hypothetical protein [Pyxidicoccus fallax]NMO19391.1 hypothetical protein [Pyxidicoccus fallax]NPC80241.1 hypothetical protein [Pyxidicoccus fallax]